MRARTATGIEPLLSACAVKRSAQVTWDIYGVPLSDVVFETETTPRGAVRCVAIGNIIAIPSTSGCSEISHNIIKEARGSLEFYWHRDKAWPYAGARLALISSMPRGGFPTSYAVWRGPI